MRSPGRSLVFGVAVALAASTPFAVRTVDALAAAADAGPAVAAAVRRVAAAVGVGRAATPTRVAAPPGAAGPARAGLADPVKKEIAMRLISSAENSSLNWRAQYGYIEDIGDGRGYTGGIVGFCSGTSDMRQVLVAYTARRPGNGLRRYLPALRRVDGTGSHAGLDPTFVRDWKRAALDPAFRAAQDAERDRVYFNPSVARAKADGLRALGQFAYYDAAVMHGYDGLLRIRADAARRARTPAQGGNEAVYLRAVLDARVREMRTESAHSDTTRVDTAQRVFLRAGNLDLTTPLVWRVYGDVYVIR